MIDTPKVFGRGPDFVIGEERNPYMLRWWLIPRNPYLNIYLHKFLRSDDDRALHDHPWASMSILLKGEYLEEMPVYPTAWKQNTDRRTIKKLRKPFRPVLRGADAIHRVELLQEKDWMEDIQCPSWSKPKPAKLKPVWSLFITGPWKRPWGFWCPKGWKPWRDFVSVRDGGNATGAGCDDK